MKLLAEVPLRAIAGESFDEGAAPDTDAVGCTGESDSDEVVGGAATPDIDALECTDGSDFDEIIGGVSAPDAAVIGRTGDSGFDVGTTGESDQRAAGWSDECAAGWPDERDFDGGGDDFQW